MLENRKWDKSVRERRNRRRNKSRKRPPSPVIISDFASADAIQVPPFGTEGKLHTDRVSEDCSHQETSTEPTGRRIFVIMSKGLQILPSSNYDTTSPRNNREGIGYRVIGEGAVTQDFVYISRSWNFVPYGVGYLFLRNKPSR